MLIGNRERFAIEISPVSPSWDRRYAPEVAGWAGLAIWTAGANLCRHVRSGEEEIREIFHVPLAPLADWIVRNYAALALEERATVFSIGRRVHDALRAWGQAPAPQGFDEDAWLDVREAFWRGHFMAAGAEGARIPNIAFLREDDDVLVGWEPPRFAATPFVEMLNPSGAATVPWGEVSRILIDFAGHVVDSFATVGAPAPYGWMQRPREDWERFDPKQAIALYCGRSYDDVASIVAQVEPLLNAASGGDPAASPACQVLRDLPPHPTPGIAGEIERAVADANVEDASRRGAWLAGRATASDAARAGLTPEEQGQLAARAIRDELSLDGQPIPSVPDLLARYGVALRDSAASFNYERMIIMGRSERTAAAAILRSARTDTRWGKRFEEARALGHALLDTMRQGAIGAASTRWAQASRRHRSGAFAAELLLPASALGTLSGDALDGAADGERFGKMLESYGVGARTAAHQLFNQGWLSDSTIRDDLIEAYANLEG